MIKFEFMAKTEFFYRKEKCTPEKMLNHYMVDDFNLMSNVKKARKK